MNALVTILQVLMIVIFALITIAVIQWLLPPTNAYIPYVSELEQLKKSQINIISFFTQGLVSTTIVSLLANDCNIKHRYLIVIFSIISVLWTLNANIFSGSLINYEFLNSILPFFVGGIIGLTVGVYLNKLKNKGGRL